MRRLALILVLAGGGVAFAKAPEPAAPITQPTRGNRREAPRLAPIPYLYRPIDLHRQNVGANGRKNATADENLNAMTPSLQPAPLWGGQSW